jgi:hypothetical protein
MGIIKTFQNVLATIYLRFRHPRNKDNYYCLVKCLYELPVLVFLFYLAFLSWKYHNREYIMQDYTLTFDHCWYFHNRLKEWTISQWNPYVLSGVPAVLWNYIPASIFSPFILLFGLTLDSFHIIFVINTFLVLTSIYAMGRLLGYGRLLPMMPVALVAGSGYLYYATNPAYIGNFMIFYPLSIATLMFALRRCHRNQISKWGLFGILLAVSITGFRLENIVYGIVFFVLVFFILTLYYLRNRRKEILLLLSGLGITIIAVLANSWHLVLLLHSTFNNNRITLIDSIWVKLSNDSLWNEISSSIFLQPLLLIIVFNFFLLFVLHYVFPSVRFIKIPVIFVLFIVGAELLFVRFLDYDNLAVSSLGFVSAIVALFFYTYRDDNISINKILAFSVALFAGFYISEYSWHTFPVNLNQFYFVMPEEFSCLLPFGVISLMLRGRFWYIAVLVLFHFIGETGCYILSDVFGIPWLASRAFLWEVPFLVIIMMETVLFFVNELFSLFALRFQWVKVSVQVLSFVFALLAIRPLMLPLDHSGNNYIERFPYMATPINYSKFEKTEWIDKAWKNAVNVKKNSVDNKSSFQRACVDKVDINILSFAKNYYKFLPAFSHTINTAPAYLSEIPYFMKIMFSEGSQKKEIKTHPEFNPAFNAYKLKNMSEEEIEFDLDYVDHVSISVHNNPVYRELLAEKGSGTPRAFVSDKVALLKNEEDEYLRMRHTLLENGSLVSEITTSDPLFLKEESAFVKKEQPLTYDVQFKRDLPESVTLEVSLNKHAYLALLDSWDSGWKVYVEGELATIYRGYIGMRFLPLSAGNHIVEFKYCTPGFNEASCISLLAWFLLFFIQLKPLVQRKLKI